MVAIWRGRGPKRYNARPLARSGRPIGCPTRLLPGTAALLVLAGCAASDARTDESQINDALLKTLTAGGKAICVDSGTFGEPLAVFRTMIVAPEAVRRLLHWSVPEPLRPGRLLSGRELVNGELRDDPSTLPEFRQDQAHLPVLAETQLNMLARATALIEPEQGVTVHPVPDAPLAVVRWWPFNRLDPRCDYVHSVSKPVIRRSIAFVTVTAAHQGTTYAFQKGAAGWSTIAKWSNWLY